MLEPPRQENCAWRRFYGAGKDDELAFLSEKERRILFRWHDKHGCTLRCGPQLMEAYAGKTKVDTSGGMYEQFCG